METILNAYESYLRNEKCMRERSIRDYMDAFRLIASRLDPITVSTYKEINDAVRYIKEARHYSQGSVYKFSICVRHLFKWLQREQYRQDNPYPFSEWRKARPSTPKFLTEGQFLSIIDDPHLTHQETALLWLLWDSGARIGEIAALEQDHIDLEKGIVNIPYEISKGNYSFRYVPIGQEAVYCLKRQFGFAQRRGHKKAIFLGDNNLPMTVSGLSKVIYKIGLRSSPLRENYRLSAHQFRHSAGIRWIERGVPQVIVQKWLGHQSLQMTSRYINMDSETSRKIFEKYVNAYESLAGVGR